MKKTTKKFVLSSNAFDSLIEAEERALGWFNAGQLKQRTKLYKITEVYELKIKFEKII